MQWDQRVIAVVVASSFGSALIGGSAVCEQEAFLTPLTPVPNQLFGRSLCVDGDTAIIGASPNTAGGLTNPGSAYIFVRNGGVWTQQAHLTAPESVPGDDFGYRVWIDGDTAIMGSRHGGSACIFVRERSDWTLQAQLAVSDGSDSFGHSVAISGDTALISAPSSGVGSLANSGAAYVFVRSGNRWTKQAQLTASDAALGDSFGWSVAIDGDTAVIGASGDDAGSISNAGSTYIFVRTNNAWTEAAHLFAAEPEEYEGFCNAVALDGDTVLVGAHHYEYHSNSGSAYVFARDGAAWNQQAHIRYPGPGYPYGSQYFGYSVSLFGDMAVISAPLDSPYGSPAVYTYIRCAGEWSQLSQVDVDCSGVFYDGETVMIGDSDAVPELAGSVRVFSCPTSPPCAADFDNDGQVSLIDTAYVLGYWSLGLPDGDINCDGIVNGFDLAQSLAAWGPCPN